MVFNGKFIYRGFLIFSILLSLLLLILQNLNYFSGFSISETTSNVTVNKYLSITFSSNLSGGIFFGLISSLPTINQNATHNYDKNFPTQNQTDYYVNISTDSNTNVDLCIKADGNLVNLANDILKLGNETYANSTITNSSVPSISDEISLTTSYIKSGENIAVGEANYYRFWLDVPIGQQSGDYNNTINFKGIQAGESC
jgi:hypothetical protein